MIRTEHEQYNIAVKYIYHMVARKLKYSTIAYQYL